MADQFLNVHFEVSKGDRKYVFVVPMRSPLGECYDACHEVLQEILKQAQDSAEKAKATKESSEAVIVD
jgi:hypothetical protein